jgi:beta-lactamase class D
MFNTKSGRRIHRKTGGGWTRDNNGQIRRNRSEGWFVGWAEQEGSVIVFARLGFGSVKGRQGLAEQEKLVAVLDNL